MKLPRLIASALACMALASCAQTPPPSAPETDSERLAGELRTLIGPASCSADTQCRTVAVGAKACGGPAGYWAWSTQGTDAKALNALAERQAAARRRELVSGGLRSNCMLATDPGATCVAGRCQLQAAASAR